MGGLYAKAGAKIGIFSGMCKIFTLGNTMRGIARAFGARVFLTFLARRASKVASWKRICVLETTFF